MAGEHVGGEPRRQDHRETAQCTHRKHDVVADAQRDADADELGTGDPPAPRWSGNEEEGGCEAQCGPTAVGGGLQAGCEARGDAGGLTRSRLSWSGLARPSIVQQAPTRLVVRQQNDVSAQATVARWILGTLGTSPSASKPEDDTVGTIRLVQNRSPARKCVLTPTYSYLRTPRWPGRRWSWRGVRRYRRPCRPAAGGSRSP